MKKYLIFGLMLFFISYCYSQTKRELENKFLNAEKLFINDKYTEAFQIYTDLLSLNPNNANLYYKIGLCFLNIPEENNLSEAISNLEIASKDVNEKSYKEKSYKETKAPPDVYYYLGNAYRLTQDYEKALVMFQKYRNYLAVNDIELISFIDREIQNTKNAVEMIKSPIEFKLQKFSERIKYPYNIDNYPVISANENVIVYTLGNNNNMTSDVNFKLNGNDYGLDSIYFSYRVADEWSAPQNISLKLECNDKAVPVCLSADGLDLYLVQDDLDDGNIYVSHYKDNTWSKAVKLNKNINTKNWESHASITSDGKSLYFTSNRAGGFGGLDIYKSDLDEKGNWGPAINLGTTINTQYDEEMPYILEDGKTLFFSSQGHYCMGGLDLFHSMLLSNGYWSSPINVGYPVNTVNNDLFYIPSTNGAYVFFPLKNINRNLGDNDIYYLKGITPLVSSFEIKISGTVSLSDNKSILPKDLKIIIIDSLNNDTADIIIPNSKGEYSYITNRGIYKIIYQGNGYKTHIENLYLSNSTNKDIVLNVPLISKDVEKGYVVIKNIYFDYDKNDLRRESQIELEKILNIMKKYPNLTLEITGYTDSKGSKVYNDYLAKKRALSAINYFINNDISPDRFVAKGIGMDKYIAVNSNSDGSDNPDGRQFNRRVEMKVLNSDKNLIITTENNIPEHLKYVSHTAHNINKIPTNQNSDNHVISINNDINKNVNNNIKNDVKNVVVQTNQNVQNNNNNQITDVNQTNNQQNKNQINKVNQVNKVNEVKTNKTNKTNKTDIDVLYKILDDTSSYIILVLKQNSKYDNKSIFNINEQIVNNEYVYTMGENYSDKEVASVLLTSIKDNGFPDANMLTVREYDDLLKSYTILLSIQKQKLTKKSFINYKEIVSGDKFIYVVGDFKTLNAAKSLLKALKLDDFPDARIIGQYELSRILNK